MIFCKSHDRGDPQLAKIAQGTSMEFRPSRTVRSEVLYLYNSVITQQKCFALVLPEMWMSPGRQETSMGGLDAHKWISTIFLHPLTCISKPENEGGLTGTPFSEVSQNIF